MEQGYEKDGKMIEKRFKNVGKITEQWCKNCVEMMEKLWKHDGKMIEQW